MKLLITAITCLFTLGITAQVDCPNPYDGNGDGEVNTLDLLGFLTVFGDIDTDSDGVWDSVDECVDLAACNYANDPTEACSYVDALGVCGGECEGDEDNDGICDWSSCGDPIEHQGYSYSTVQIGEQCWFSENCRYLPVVSPSSASSVTSPYYYVYGYEGADVAAAQATDNYDTYGVLYNWPAVMTEDICPSGWHIPSDGEWQTMEISLGMSEAQASSTGDRGTDEGNQMKSASGWNDYNGSTGNGSNSSGFTGLPGGYRQSGDFYSNGNVGLWWSASESGSDSWGRGLFNGNSKVTRNSYSQSRGLSARCVKD